MTERASPTSADASVLDRLLARRISLNWEIVLWAIILAAAFALRFWDLGARALHHDESIHAKWAWDFAQGHYRHSPVYHGPFLYVVQGFTFLVGTATDYTARISPALFGMGVVAAPLALRRWLGSGGALTAGAFLALSPTAVYYSRFLRMDIYLALFTLLAVAALWRYLHGGRARWLVVYAAALALAFSTKEVAFLLVAFLLLALNGHLAGDLARATLRERSEGTSRWRFAALAASCFPVAWAVAALWPLLERPRRALAWRELPRSGDLLVLTGTLTLPLLTAFAKGPIVWLLGVLGENAAGRFDYATLCSNGDANDLLVLGGAFALSAGLAAATGVAWRPRLWLAAAGLAVIVYATLMTSFWANLDGLCSGPWGSIDHWQAQQDYRRGDQPWFYYLMLMPAYEFLTLIPALIGGVWAIARGPSFARFLVAWFLALFIALSFAGEKMPWLTTHLAVPSALLAAWTLQRAWSAWGARALDRRAAIPLAVALAAAVLAAVVLALDWGPPTGVRLVWGGGLAFVAILAVAVAARAASGRALPALAALLLLAAFACLSVRAMLLTVYERGDVPDDLLIYTQSSPRVTELADDIDALAAASGRGRDLRIAVDTRSSLHWPWVWYLRDYRRVSYANMENGPPAGAFDVVLVSAANGDAVRDGLADGGVDHAPPVRHPHRWWFREVYKEWPVSDGEGSARWGEPYEAETWRRIAEGVIRRNWLGDAFAFWLDREPPHDPGALDALAFFLAGFDRETGRVAVRAAGAVPAADPPPPTTDAASRAVFGERGDGPGQFLGPVDIEAGPDGSLYVIDRVTRRLQRFDADGNLLASVDVRASPDEESEPWGLAVAADGRVYVADTFGWRVLAFDGGTLERVLAFGERPLLDDEPPGPHHLYGPRDIAIDANGDLWVTDTGHNRIVVYTPDGEYLREFGAPFAAASLGRGFGPGQFNEPVGIAIGPGGEIAVADMWNARVQVLDASGAYLREFPVPGWGGLDAADKPWLRVLRDGRIALTVPSAGEARVYSASGALLAVIAPADEPLLSPYGLLETADGKLWIVEGARVRRFAIPEPVEP